MTKKNNDDLIGFKDFIDHEAKQSAPKASRRDNDFELITFLEQDSIRLTKHIEAFEEKVYVIKNFPQEEKLLAQQERILKAKKETMLGLCSRNDSPLILNLSELFQIFFNS